MSPAQCHRGPALPSRVVSTFGSTIAGQQAARAEFLCSSPDKRTRILFINSALLPGADTGIHFLLLRNLPQERFELHAAGQPGSPAPAFDELRTIPGIALRPTNFGPSLWRRSNLQKLVSIAGAPPAAASLVGLAIYLRPRGI